MSEPKLDAREILAGVQRILDSRDTLTAVEQIFPGISAEKDDAVRNEMLRRAVCGITMACCKVYGEAVSAEYERTEAKMSSLEDDLKSAVRVAHDRGAVEWARLNYPDWTSTFGQPTEPSGNA